MAYHHKHDSTIDTPIYCQHSLCIFFPTLRPLPRYQFEPHILTLTSPNPVISLHHPSPGINLNHVSLGRKSEGKLAMVALILDQPVGDDAIAGMIAHADLSNCVQIRLREYVDPNFRVQSSNQQGIVYGSNKPMVTTIHTQSMTSIAHGALPHIFYKQACSNIPSQHTFLTHPSFHPLRFVPAIPNFPPVLAKNVLATTSPIYALIHSVVLTDRNWAKHD